MRRTEARAGVSLPLALERPFKLIAFDWDGTAVTNRAEDAGAVRQLLDGLLRAGVPIVVITGTNFPNIDRQLTAAMSGPHKARLYVATNRGSEVYGFDTAGRPVLRWLRPATPEEDRLLTEIADTVRDRLASEHGLQVQVVHDRLNRRKLDLIPLAEWADPDKSAIAELLKAVKARLRDAGIEGGLGEVLALAERTAIARGLPGARITSDAKHIEIGLTDKGDAVAWLMRELARPQGIRPEDILILGDEFGTIAEMQGSDEKMEVPDAKGAVFVSVGREPEGVPAGVIHIPGGPALFREVLAAQLALNSPRVRTTSSAGAQELGLPAALTRDPSWLLVDEGADLALEPGVESLFTVSNGYAGTRGSLPEGTALSSPATYIAGVFDQKPGFVPELAVAPDWTRLRITVEGEELRLEAGEVLEHRRMLDMRQGIFGREWRQRDPSGRVTLVRSMRFASRDDPHVLVQSLLLVPENYSGRVRVEARIDRPERGNRPWPPHVPCLVSAGIRPTVTPSPVDPAVLLLRTESHDLTVAIAASSVLRARGGAPIERATEAGPGWLEDRWEWEAQIGTSFRLDRLVAVYTARDSQRPGEDAGERAERLAREGIEGAVTAHVGAWEGIWASSGVDVAGDVDAQRALRFAVYHLGSAVNPRDERVSIGARALTGDSYKGHVFWDTETYALPFYTYTQPQAARALLMYRYHTLPAAREKARRMGYHGALYAWESTDTGEETTPRFVYGPKGEAIRVLTGEQEHHISADIAYAVWQYWQATGDEPFLLDAGAEIIIETARFWASIAKLEADGQYHIRGVIGPDEYHESVDDSAYTNGMAQWNLETACEVARLIQGRWPQRWQALRQRLHVDPEDVLQWQAVAKGLATGLDPRTGLFEQFAGFFDLERVDMSQYPQRKVPLDVLLGRERTQRMQVVKQADVVLLVALLWDRLSPEVREANFRYYEPITGHGSSLSPAMHALVAARLGNLSLAERFFRQAAEIDLANNMGNCAGGVHIAALGGLWQAAVLGFAGLSVREWGLELDPRLPRAWKHLRFHVTFHGTQIEFDVAAGAVLTVEARSRTGGPVSIAMLGGEKAALGPDDRLRAERAGNGWTWHNARE